MFRRSSVALVATLSVWLVAAVAFAAPSKTVALTLSSPTASVDFSIVNGQVVSVVGSALCANGELETWRSDRVVSSVVEFGNGPRLNRIAASVDVQHTACNGTLSSANVSIRTLYDEVGKTVRERDGSSGTRTLTTPVAGTITLPNQVLAGAEGSEVETIAR